MRVQVGQIAHTRSGDKGEHANVGVVADSPEAYRELRRALTPERVKEHFREMVRGEVTRYEVPNVLALNFILGDALGGGGTASLLDDAQGKTYGQGLLLLEIEVPDDVPVRPLGPGAARPGARSG